MRAVFFVLLTMIIITATISVLLAGRNDAEVQTLKPGEWQGSQGNSLLRSVCEAAERQGNCPTLSAGITARECCGVFRKCC